MKVSSSEDVYGDNSGTRRDARGANGEEAGRTDVTTSLPRALRTLEAPGDYFGAGEVVLPVVRIHVEGVGLLGLPIVPAQAEALAKGGADAPYGRGPDTLSIQPSGAANRSMPHRFEPTTRGGRRCSVRS